MSHVWLFILLGLGAGAVYAILATGVVATFRGAGVINFAQGSMALLPAFAVDELRRTGDLVLPLVVIPHRIHIGPVDAVAALIIGIGYSLLLGAAVYFLVFRPLRRSPAVGKIIATVGLMLIIQGFAAYEFGSDQRIVPPILPNGPVSIGDITVPRDRIWAALTALALAGALALLSRYSRIGMAVRAGAEDEEAVALVGRSPARLALVSWLLSCGVSGLAGILLSPITGLSATSFTFAVVPALAAALLARLTSTLVAAVAGLGLGIVESLLLLAQTKSWYPDWLATGGKESIPLLVVLGALLLFGRRLPQRGDHHAAELPDVPRAPLSVVRCLAAVAMGAVLMVALPGGYRLGLITSLVVVPMCLSLVVVTGLLGQLSLAQAAFAGCAGFALSVLGESYGVPFPITPLLAAGCATVLGVVVGLPALRIRGPQLAVVTLAVGLAIQQLVFNNATVGQRSGQFLVDGPALAGLDLNIRTSGSFPSVRFGLFTLVVVSVAMWLVARLSRGQLGHRFLAVRANERAAASIGINVWAVKLLGFGISAFLAGLGGAMTGYLRGTLSVESFGVLASLTVLAVAYVGGITSVTGALMGGYLAAGGLAFTIGERLVNMGDFYLIVSGLALVLTVQLQPAGMAAGLPRLRWPRRERERPSVVERPGRGWAAS